MCKRSYRKQGMEARLEMLFAATLARLDHPTTLCLYGSSLLISFILTKKRYFASLLRSVGSLGLDLHPVQSCVVFFSSVDLFVVAVCSWLLYAKLM